MTSHRTEARIEALEARIVELETALERQPPAASIDRPVGAAVDDGTDGRRSRRTVLKIAASAGGAAVAAALVAKPVAATDGNDVVIGGNNTSAGGNTRILANSGGAFIGKNIFTAQDTSFATSFPSAIGGFAAGNRVHNGVYGFSQDRTASTSTGHALIGWATPGGRSHLYLFPAGSDPRDDAYAHARGEFRVDSSGNVWSCVVAGTPGTWQKLAGPSTSGAFHAITPARTYDSRRPAPTPGRISTGESRVVSVADARNLSDGSVITAGIVPAGATAVAYNVTVEATASVGFLSVNPGDVASFGASSINWSSSNLTLGNAGIVKLDGSRQIKVFAGGPVGSSTEFIIDITGYYI
jgi:hypothetical protein